MALDKGLQGAGLGRAASQVWCPVAVPPLEWQWQPSGGGGGGPLTARAGVLHHCGRAP
jgi:hypothetical protein